MATANPFDLLGNDDTDDLSQLIAAQKVAPAAAPKNPQPPAAQAKHQPAQPKSAKQLPSKPAQTVIGRETRNEAGHGGGRGGGGSGRGYARGRGGGGGGGGYRRDFGSDENSFSNSGFLTGQGAPEDGEAGKTSERRGGFGGPHGPYRGGRGGGFSNGDGGEGDRPRRTFERRSGTGHGNELKREGSGRGNWGSQTDEFSQVTEEINESEKILGNEKPAGDGDAADVDKESPTKEPEEKEPEDKEMTLEEYQKVLEEKRKALQALKTVERKVDVKEFESMQQLSNKKGNDDVFIKLGSDKDRKKEAAEKEEKAKKAVNITEFLKPTEGEKYYNPGGRGRGRGGRGSRGGYGGGGSSVRNVPAPSIEDPGEFPTLGAK